MSKKTFLYLFGGLIALSLFIFLVKLGSTVLVDYDEATYAQVIDATMQSGNIYSLRISPTENWFDKPPLYIWEAMASGDVFSNPSFAYRFPSAVAGVVGIILTVLIGCEITKTYGVALLSGLILLSTGAYVEAGRQVRMDVPVTAAILLAFYGFLKARKQPEWFLLLGAGIGIGVFTKSIIGFFVFPAIIIWSLIYKEWKWLRSGYFWLGQLVIILILLPWHIYESLQYGKVFWNNYFLYHILARFDQNILGLHVSNFTYFLALLRYSAPWVILFCFGLILLPYFYQKDRDAFRTLLFLSVVPVFIFCVFLCSKTKLLQYLIPIYPFVALFLAYLFFCLSELSSRHKVAVIGLLTVIIFPFAFYWTSLVGGNQLIETKGYGIFAEEEAKIGAIVKEHPEVKETYVFDFPYLETLRYYSGGRTFGTLDATAKLDQPAFLVVRSDFLETYGIVPGFEQKITKEYSGNNLSLLLFNP